MFKLLFQHLDVVIFEISSMDEVNCIQFAVALLSIGGDFNTLHCTKIKKKSVDKGLDFGIYDALIR